MPYFAVIGRVRGDDETTVFVCEADGVEQAEELFRSAMHDVRYVDPKTFDESSFEAVFAVDVFRVESSPEPFTPEQVQGFRSEVFP